MQLSTLRAEVKYIWMDKRWTQLKVAYIAKSVPSFLSSPIFYCRPDSTLLCASS